MYNTINISGRIHERERSPIRLHSGLDNLGGRIVLHVTDSLLDPTLVLVSPLDNSAQRPSHPLLLGLSGIAEAPLGAGKEERSHGNHRKG